MYIYLSISLSTYIYIYREREREMWLSIITDAAKYDDTSCHSRWRRNCWYQTTATSNHTINNDVDHNNNNDNDKTTNNK